MVFGSFCLGPYGANKIHLVDPRISIIGHTVSFGEVCIVSLPSSCISSSVLVKADFQREIFIDYLHHIAVSGNFEVSFPIFLKNETRRYDWRLYEYLDDHTWICSHRMNM